MNASDLNGNWTYRSFNNITALVGDYAKKALALIFGEGALKITAKGPSIFHAVLDLGGGSAMDLYGEVVPGQGFSPVTFIITGTGREKTSTAKWVYPYKGYVAPQWAEGVKEVPAIVGTVIRTIPHGSGAAGVTASFVMLKK